MLSFQLLSVLPNKVYTFSQPSITSWSVVIQWSTQAMQDNIGLFCKISKQQYVYLIDSKRTKGILVAYTEIASSLYVFVMFIMSFFFKQKQEFPKEEKTLTCPKALKKMQLIIARTKISVLWIEGEKTIPAGIDQFLFNTRRSIGTYCYKCEIYGLTVRGSNAVSNAVKIYCEHGLTIQLSFQLISSTCMYTYFIASMCMTALPKL